MATDAQFTQEFLQIVANVNSVSEQLRAVIIAVDVGAVIRLSAAASEEIARQWRDDDAAGSFVLDKKRRCILKDFSEHLQGADNNVSSHVVFP
jgi:hypothetical protein